MSTARQGEKGVSLPEQKDVIERYAARNGLHIIELVVERMTAAKSGRPLWNAMIKLLRQGKAAGIIIHKIDRSARNRRDWADFNDLIDEGIDVHVASEPIDFRTRGGRLTADLQAVVAVDYIRNLRDEAKKGFYGRLKQGFYPLPAPIGYLNHGAAQAKTIDPEKGSLVRQAFELYVGGKWSIPTLVDELYRRGLRNRAGGRVTKNGLHTILRNPFYAGVMRISATNETFLGNHESLISKSTFDRVQDILHGRIGTRVNVHDFLFRRFVKCSHCGYSLIGEIQKGIVYYRCHTKSCPTTSLREDIVAASLSQQLKRLEFTEPEKNFLRKRIAQLKASWIADRERELQTFNLKIEQATERLNRLTDAYLDQVLDRGLFEARKAAVIFERRALEDTLRDYQTNKRSVPEELEKFIELAGNAYSLYKNADRAKIRRLLRTVTSNCTVGEKNLDFVFTIPFREIAGREKSDDGGASREIARTLIPLLRRLAAAIAENPTVDPSSVELSKEWLSTPDAETAITRYV